LRETRVKLSLGAFGAKLEVLRVVFNNFYDIIGIVHLKFNNETKLSEVQQQVFAIEPIN
jgi:hypothetical protein